MLRWRILLTIRISLTNSLYPTRVENVWSSIIKTIIPIYISFPCKLIILNTNSSPNVQLMTQSNIMTNSKCHINVTPFFHCFVFIIIFKRWSSHAQHKPAQHSVVVVPPSFSKSFDATIIFGWHHHHLVAVIFSRHLHYL